MLEICIVVLVLWKSLPIGNSGLAACGFAAVVPVFICCLSSLEHSRAPRTSILLNSYLALTLLFDVVQTRTAWLSAGFGTRSYAILLAMATGVKAVIAVLEAIPKRRWQISSLREASPEETSGLYSLAFLSWLNPLIAIGSRKILKTDDLYPLDSNLSAKVQLAELQQIWKKTESSPTRNLPLVLLRSLSSSLLQAVPCRLLLLGFSFCQPVFIRALINYLQNDPSANKHAGTGLILASILIYASIALSTSSYWYLHFRTLTKARSSLVTAIFNHATQLNSNHLNTSVLTLMSTDVERVSQGMYGLHELWANTLEVALAAWLLQRQLGAAFVAPIIVVLICVAGTVGVGRFSGRRQGEWTQRTENRVKMTSAVVANMRPLRISGMARPGASLLQGSREDELTAGNGYRILTVFSTCIAFTPLLMSPVVTFAVTGRQLDMSTVFSSLSYLTLLASPLSQLFQRVPMMLASLTSFRRIQTFLETEPRVDYRVFTQGLDNGVAISLDNASIGWAKDQFQLHGLSFSIPKSQLTVVTGPVASGKSTFCKALLGEVPFTDGTITFHQQVSARTGFCDQTPFLTNGTIRSNIVGFEPFDGPLYGAVLEAVLLKDDLRTLSQGDETQVGSNGVTLSGGQRQRVALARALYLDADLYVLDDFTSGLDKPTADQVVGRLFGPDGFLSRRKATIVWCTHSIHYLHLADFVIALGADGQVLHQGAPEKILDNRTMVSALDLDNVSTDSEEGALDGVKTEKMTARINTTAEQDDPKRNLHDAAVYTHYFGALGPVTILCVLSTGAVFGFLYSFGTIWLKFWSDNTFQISPQSHINRFYLGIYAVLQSIAIVVLGLYLVSANMSMATVSGSSLHLRAVGTLMHAPLGYFSATDQGATVNLFSQDMGLLDMSLPMAISNTILSGSTAAGQAVVVAVGSPLVTAGYPLLPGALYVLQRYYLRASRQLRLLDLENKSPLYAQFSDVARGIASVRAFGWAGDYAALNRRCVDDSQRPRYLLSMVQLWLSTVLSLITAVIVVAVTALATQMAASSRAGFVGASLVSLMTFGDLVNAMVQCWVQLETSLGAVKRLKDFENVAGSEDRVGEDLRPGAEWPERGVIVLDGVSASYAEGKGGEEDGSYHLALKDVYMTINAGEKVAIVGRTGR